MSLAKNKVKHSLEYLLRHPYHIVDKVNK